MMNVALKEADSEYSLYSVDNWELRVRDVSLREGQLPQYLPVGDLWEEFEAAVRLSFFPPDFNWQKLFRAYMRALGADDDQINFCASCGRPDWNDELSTETEDGTCCDDCVSSHYQECPSCERTLRARTMNEGRYTLAEDLVCESCIDAHYNFCEACDGWYHDEDADYHDHDHDYDACCDSPQPCFRVRNGSGVLASDTRTEVALPSRISREGLDKIRALFFAQDSFKFHNLTYHMNGLSAEWQTRAGNYPKRLSRLAYETLSLKIPPEILSQVGTIARDHSKAAALDVEVTRQLNMSAESFCNSGSCWWGTYSESRCALKTNGGFGLRSFDGREANGRAWVLPLRLDDAGKLTPTFDTETPDAFVVFNGYGELSGYVPARIMAQLAGWTYAKIGFSCEPMYVNSGGYLVAPEETVRGVEGLNLNVEQHAYLYETEKQGELARAA